MSQTTNEINKITSTIIAVSSRLIIYALVFILLYEGITKGYAFGHEMFAPTPAGTGAGVEKTVEIGADISVSETARLLKKKGLIKDELIFKIQAMFFEYEINPGTYTLSTSMTSKDILQALNDKVGEDEAKE